ncbi:MAG: diacylglycerol kinase family protein [Chitinophagales bacterium]|nr:diacylglycerol kinase family protein [Chitinophagales bacterium]
MKNDRSLLSNFFNGFRFALAGLRSAFLSELNIKFHFAAAIVVIVAGIYFNVTSVDWLLIVGAIGFVLTAEYLNTAIEQLTDLASPQFSEKAGRVKDIAASAVLIASITAATIGMIIFYPYLIK